MPYFSQTEAGFEIALYMYIPSLPAPKCQIKQHLTVLVKFLLYINTVVETGTVEIPSFLTIFCRFFSSEYETME